MEGKKEGEEASEETSQQNPEVEPSASRASTVKVGDEKIDTETPAPDEVTPAEAPSKEAETTVEADEEVPPKPEAPSEGEISAESDGQVTVSSSKTSGDRKLEGVPSKTKTPSDSKGTLVTDKVKSLPEIQEEAPPADVVVEPPPKKKPSARQVPAGMLSCLTNSLPHLENFSCSKLLTKRTPYIHNPPQPEDRRPRVDRPRSPRDYIINLREDLADFQETHGLPRTRDYSFMSLGLALAQETARAICSVFVMFSELFPVIAIISLVLRFALDKLIDILETNEPGPKMKKTLIFCLQMVMILIPLWILIGTIVLPLAGLLFSIFRQLLRFRDGKSARQPINMRLTSPFCTARVPCRPPKKESTSTGLKKIESPKKKPNPSCTGPSS